MKAIDLLSWLLKEDVETSAMDIIQVDGSFDFESFFGYTPDVTVPDGEYMYMYSDTVLEGDVQRLLDETEDQPYAISTDLDDRKNGGKCIIWLFKLEE